MLVDLRPGQPVRFGKHLAKGLRLKGLELEAFDVTPENEGDRDQVGPDQPESRHRVHDGPARGRRDADADRDLPERRGVRLRERGAYDQIEKARQKQGPGDLHKLLYSGDLWEVS